VFVRWALLSATVVSGIGVFEFFFSDAWNNFAVDVLEVPRYYALILSSPVLDANDIRVYGTIGDNTIVRVGSVYFGAGVGTFLLGALAFAAHRVVRRDARMFTYVSGALILVIILLSQTRSAAIGALVVLLLIARRPGAAFAVGRAQFALVALLVLALAAPFSAATGLSNRVSSGDTLAAHVDATSTGVEQIVSNPIGGGLGTASLGTRFGADAVTAENAYLQVGDELGIVAMILFLVVLLASFRALGRVARTSGSIGDVAYAVRCGGIALFVAGMFLHVWGFEQALLYWVGVAVVLNEHALQRAKPTPDRNTPALR
jgi:hypothetical protein